MLFASIHSLLYPPHTHHHQTGSRPTHTQKAKYPTSRSGGRGGVLFQECLLGNVKPLLTEEWVLRFPFCKKKGVGGLIHQFTAIHIGKLQKQAETFFLMPLSAWGAVFPSKKEKGWKVLTPGLAYRCLLPCLPSKITVPAEHTHTSHQQLFPHCSAELCTGHFVPFCVSYCICDHTD